MARYLRKLFIPLILLPFVAFSQKDYLVTIKGDTIRGKISLLQIGKVEQVSVKGEKRETFTPMQVRELLIDDVKYKPVQFSGAIQFMQIINEGYLSLLAFKPPGTMMYDGRLLKASDGRMQEVPTIGFKKHIAKLVSDDVGLAAKIEKGELGRKDLDKIISEYNAFISGNTETSMSQSQMSGKQKTKLEVLAGLKDDVEKSPLSNRQELMDMLADMESKIQTEKPIPSYLLKNIRTGLESSPDLILKWTELEKMLSL
jgi:hypothetical protein